MRQILRSSVALCLVATICLPSIVAGARVTVSEPFEGVTHYRIHQEQPRRVSIHLLQVDPAAPGIGFLTTPSNGDLPGDTVHQTTREFVTQYGLQIGINANFSNYVSGPYMNLLNIAASNGDVYSPFYAGWPGINITQDNQVSLVTPVPENVSHDPPDFYSGYEPAQNVTLYNTIGGNELILYNGEVVATWADGLHPRTAAGVSADGKLLLFTVDGRNTGHSQGMSTAEVARILRQYGAIHGMNLDGGGSTTLVFADPSPRVVNIPVGVSNTPGSERRVGNNFGVFARVREQPLKYRRFFASFEHLVDVPAAEGSLFLRSPGYSGSTSGNLEPFPDDSIVVGDSDLPPGGKGNRALRLRWRFRPGLEHPWLRVSTHTTEAALGQPIVSFKKFVRFAIHSNQELTALLLVRNTASQGDDGATGTATGGFEFIGGPAAADGQVVALPPEGKKVPAGKWTTLYFDMANEPVTGWHVSSPSLDGNGVLETERGVIQSLVFLPKRDAEGAYSTEPVVVYLNQFEVADTGPPRLKIQREDEGAGLRVVVTGEAFAQYEVEISDDLVGWNPAGTVKIGSDGEGTFLDSEAENDARRFYRLK